MGKSAAIKQLERAEWVRKSKVVIFFALVILVCAVFYFYGFEPSTRGNDNLIEAHVIALPQSGVHTSNTKYRVRLPSGLVVRVRGLAVLPRNYNGKVFLRKERGVITGRDIYYIQAKKN